MPIAYLVQIRGHGYTQKRHVYHLHVTDNPLSLCGHVAVGPNWQSVGDLASFSFTPEGLFVRRKRLCAICAALRQPYERLDQARHKGEET